MTNPVLIDSFAGSEVNEYKGSQAGAVYQSSPLAVTQYDSVLA